MTLKSTTVQTSSIYKYVIMPCVSSQTFTFNILKENTSQVVTVSYTIFTSLEALWTQSQTKKGGKDGLPKKSLVFSSSRFKSQCYFLVVCDLGQVT